MRTCGMTQTDGKYDGYREINRLELVCTSEKVVEYV